MKFLWAALGVLVVVVTILLWPHPTEVIFQANGGDGTPKVQLIAKGDSVPLLHNTFVRKGYQFLGWARSVTGPVVLADGEPYTMQKTIRLWAIWKPLVYRLTFDPNGGTGQIPALTRSTDSTAPLPLQHFTRPGYHFVGWATQQNGPAVGADGAVYRMGPSNTTLYAVWGPNQYQISFEASGALGSMPPEFLFTGQQALLHPNTFVRPGYLFAGWALSPHGGIFYPDRANVVMRSGNLPLYAVWVAQPTMLPVPGGTFQRDQRAEDTSTVLSFLMSRYDITRAQFYAVMQADPSYSGDSSGWEGPVENVSWYQAIAFCNELSLKEGLTPVYSVPGVDFRYLSWSEIPSYNNTTWNSAQANPLADGFRLPTEMEWMWAAMGATSDSLRSDWHDKIDTGGWKKGYAGSREPYGEQKYLSRYAVYGWGPRPTSPYSPQKTAVVGSKLPNELGLYDLSGNVWQWCWDWDGHYPSGRLNNYQGPPSGEERVLRGSSWVDFSSLFRLSFRNDSSPEKQHTNVGFRVVRSEIQKAPL
ncbi:MAG: SUMF1/EgtB/PvdO family nonheme iron enzyme [Spirochaetales bacterium]|nr:SUMF1/EgtB/PvdO family nonheme iron enzyme [Spirochaetales bacterium]